MEERTENSRNFSGQADLVEAVELPQQPWIMWGYGIIRNSKSRPNKAHPLFREFIAAALKQK